MSQPQSVPRPSDKWIPYYFVGFFILLISILIPMAVIAFRTHSGVITEHAYEKGLAYNQDIAAQKQQAILQWNGELTALHTTDNQTQIDLALADKDGKDIDNADVTLLLIRPTQEGMDQKTKMIPVSSGHYSIKISLPASGLWDAQISALLGEKNFQMAKRFTLP